MLVVLLSSPGTTRGVQGDSRSRGMYITVSHRQSGEALHGRTLKTLWKAWSRGVPSEKPTYRDIPSLVGSHPTQLLPFYYFSETSLSLHPSKVGIVLLGTNTQELPRATRSQFSQCTNFTCQKINSDLLGKPSASDLPSGSLNPVPQQVMWQDLPAPPSPAPFHLGALTTTLITHNSFGIILQSQSTSTGAKDTLCLKDNNLLLQLGALRKPLPRAGSLVPDR